MCCLRDVDNHPLNSTEVLILEVGLGQRVLELLDGNVCAEAVFPRV